MEQITKNRSVRNLSSVIYHLTFIHSAFTIMELLVSLTIIMLIVSVAVAGYSRFNDRQTLLNAGQTMKNVLRDAQSRSYNGEMDCSLGVCDCTPASTTVLDGWYADFDNRSIYGSCSSHAFPTPIAFPFTSDVKISPYLTPSAENKILFKAYPPSIDKRGTICLATDKLSGQYYKIQIENSGEISDQSSLVGTCP